MSKKVKEYSAEFKAKVVLELLKETTTQTEISQKYGIPTGTLRAWYNHFLENAEDIFQTRQKDKENKALIKSRANEIDHLHKMVGELTVKVDWLKKKHRQVGLEYPKEFDK